MVQFSIIIPNYNGMHFLHPCLDSILNQDYTDYEIIVVDNASDDGSADFILNNYPQVKTLNNSYNRGYAGGCNDGYRISTGDYILMLNSDTILESSCLYELDLAIHEYPLCGMYAPKILYPDGRINAAGSESSICGSSWERGKGEPDVGQYDQPCEVFGPYGAAALFSKDLLEITNGFDEDFFLFVEETDLTFRARLAGYSCRYVPRAVVVHYHGGTAGRVSDIALYYLHRNSVWYVVKNYPLSLLFFSMPLFISRNLIIILYYILIGRGKIILLAKYDALRRFPMFINKRKREYYKRRQVHLRMRLF